MKKWAWLAVAGAVVLAVVAVVLWINNYHQVQDSQYELKAVNTWTILQTWLNTVNEEATRKDKDERQYEVDFTATRNLATLAKSEVDKNIKNQGAKAPPRFQEFNTGFIDLLGKLSALFQSIVDNTNTWSQKDMNDLDTKVADFVSAQNTVFSSWPAGRKALIQPNQIIFKKVTKAFNATRKARQQAASSTENTGSSGGSFAMPTDPTLVIFVNQMRSIITRYKGLRHSLSVFLDGIKGDAPGVSIPCGVWLSACQNPSFQAGIDGRDALIGELDSMTVPYQYSQSYAAIRGAIQSAADAMRMLRDKGDYSRLKAVSDSNDALISAMKSYGY